MSPTGHETVRKTVHQTISPTRSLPRGKAVQSSGPLKCLSSTRMLTILVVDNDPQILGVVSALFAEEYHVLSAATGALGLEQSRNFKGKICVLLSEFQMAGGMSGVDLATVMTADRPGLKVLLMSGFPGGMLVLNEGWHFLPKPFVPSQLRALVVGLASPDKGSRFVAKPREPLIF